MSEHGSPGLIEAMRGPVMWLSINREERRNAISPGVLAGLPEVKVGQFALTEDAAAGQLAFREKRKPVWTGH